MPRAARKRASAAVAAATAPATHPPHPPHRTPARYTLAEWHAEATRRFGPETSEWRFVCPVCAHDASAAEYEAAGAPESAVAFSCVGRWIAGSQDAFTSKGAGPCTYAGGGLFRLNPVIVTAPDGAEHQMFAFAAEVAS